MTPGAAASAYASAARAVVQQATQSGNQDATAQAGNFDAALQQAVGEMVNDARGADLATLNALQGQGDMAGLVTAIAESEVAMETLVTLRDRVISAYEQIMRMPI